MMYVSSFTSFQQNYIFIALVRNIILHNVKYKGCESFFSLPISEVYRGLTVVIAAVVL